MIPTLLLSLLATGNPAPASTPVAIPVWQDAKTATLDYDALVAEYEQAKRDHRKKIRSLKGKEKLAAKKKHPAMDFMPRFEALVEQGDGRGLLWQVETFRDRRVKKDQREALRLDAYTKLLRDYPKAPWLSDAIAVVGKDRALDVDVKVRLLQHLAKDEKQAQSDQLTAQYYAGLALFKTKDEAKKKLGKALLKELQEGHPKSRAGLLAKAILEKPDLSIGAVAPEFVGKTIDGEEIALSDYRGKVVLVDFFGFW